MALLTYSCKNNSGSSWSLSTERIDRAIIERQVRIGATEMKLSIGQASMICSLKDLQSALVSRI